MGEFVCSLVATFLRKVRPKNCTFLELIPPISSQPLIITCILKPTKPRFQRKVMYDNVPVDAAKEFRTLAAAEGQELLEKLDRWLSHRDRDVNPASKGAGRVRVGLGIYHFEEQEQSD